MSVLGSGITGEVLNSSTRGTRKGRFLAVVARSNLLSCRRVITIFSGAVKMMSI
jgi:hypothetical protein